MPHADKYNIRAEFPSGNFLDFTVNSDDLPAARTKAQDYLRQQGRASIQSKFDWRGQVVFVDHTPSIG